VRLKKGLEHHTKYRIPVQTGQGAGMIKIKKSYLFTQQNEL
jgi:hypothetical protein